MQELLQIFIPKIKKWIPVYAIIYCFSLLLTGNFEKLYLIIKQQAFFMPEFLPVIFLVNSSDTSLLFPVICYNSFYNKSKNEYINKLVRHGEALLSNLFKLKTGFG
jgi:predicted membrane protein